MVSTPSILAEANPEKDQVIYGLATRRAEQAGLIERLEAQLKQAKSDLDHLDAVLVMWGVEKPEKAVRVKKATTAGLFHAKELPRLIRDILRINPNGQTSRELSVEVSIRKGWDEKDERFITALSEKITRLMCEWYRQERIGKVKRDGLSVWKRPS